MILLIKPFVSGDYIVACGEEGTVTSIDMCYTKLTTLDERIVILPNGTLANTTIINNTTTPHRRADIIVSVAYDADINLAKKLVLDILNSSEFVLKDRDIVVYVANLAASSVDLGIRYYTKNDESVTIDKMEVCYVVDVSEAEKNALDAMKNLNSSYEEFLNTANENINKINEIMLK